MEVFYVVAVFGGIFLIVVLLTGSRRTYHCQKCGFRTDNELEAAGHEKLENSHRVIQD